MKRFAMSHDWLRQAAAAFSHRFFLTPGLIFANVAGAAATELGIPETQSTLNGTRASLAGSGQAQGPLRVHPTNPRYFTDGSGKAVYLTGSHTWDIFQRWLEGNLDGNNRMGRPADFAAYLHELRNHHHNFVRFWVADTAWSPVTKAAIEPQPYARTGPGKAADGGLKFDLHQLNQAYFDELRTRVIAARDGGLYVGVMLFNGWGVGVYQTRRITSPGTITRSTRRTTSTGLMATPTGTAAAWSTTVWKWPRSRSSRKRMSVKSWTPS
jgi:hypothetical protein